MFTLLFRHDLLQDSGQHLREHSLPILDALSAVLQEEPREEPTARVSALAIWTQVHGIATLTLTRALDDAASPQEQAQLLRSAVSGHMKGPDRSA
jgi:hypothetical protein